MKLAILASSTLSACTLFIAGLSGGHEIAVENQSAETIVVMAQDTGLARYYAVTSEKLGVVDAIAEGNFPSETITLYDTNCVQLAVLDRDFTFGALITVREEGAPLVVLERRASDQSADPEHSGAASCEEALGNGTHGVAT